MWDKITTSIGKAWGAVTTTLLGILVAVQPVFMAVDPQLLMDSPKLRWTIFGVGVVVAVLRPLAPPARKAR